MSLNVAPGATPDIGKTAVVLFNLGGPDGQEAVEPFLFNLFNDPAIIGLPGWLRRLVAWRLSARRAPEMIAAPVADRRLTADLQAWVGGSSPSDFSHAAKSSVPGKGVSITNWAKVSPARSATESVASKVSLRSLGNPKMNDPSTCTPWRRNCCSRCTSPSPLSLNPL